MTDTLKLCTICGEPCTGNRCPTHTPPKVTKTSRHARGYGNAWSRLSERARRLQPWCSDCGTREDLTGDHLVWPATKLEHVDVVCRTCNSARGPARQLPTTTGHTPRNAARDPRGKAYIPTLGTEVES